MNHVVVVGGGISGLATAHRLVEQAGDRLRVTVLEAGRRWGGKVQSERRDGFVIDAGPDSFIPQKPQTLELVRALGLGEQLLASNDQDRGLAIVHRGKLEPVPGGLHTLVPKDWQAIRRSPLLTWRGRLGLWRERWVPARADEAGDESVADFARRRFGDEVFERLAEPMLSHIHVGDAERMSLAATYPRFAAMEHRHGGFFRAHEARRAGGASGGRPGTSAAPARPPGRGKTPLFWSLAGGMGQLIEALVQRLGEADLRKGVAVRSITPGNPADPRWRVETSEGPGLRADAVVLAAPTFAAADMVRAWAPQLALGLDSIRYVSLATLSLGFRRRDVAQLPAGFGFFVPKGAPLRLLAGTWSSTKFEGRAPDDRVLVRLFLGGATQEGVLALEDDALVAAVRADLAALTGLEAEPILTHLERWKRGYPQYEVGHLERVRNLTAALPEGLHLVGSGYGGVGLSDCIRGGYGAADRVVEGLREAREALVMEGVAG